MSTRRNIYEWFYQQAKDEKQLPWHREEIPLLLLEVAEAQTGRKKVLDIGCGTGVYSVYLAQQGYEVTAIDFVASALEYARQRADRERTLINFIHTDITLWDTDEHFDIVLDSGCLHGFGGADRKRYKERLLKWMNTKANYVLIHFARRSWLDLNFAGPRRKTRKEIERFFGPDLKLNLFYEDKARSLNQYIFGK